MFFEQIRKRIPFLNSKKTHLRRKKEFERVTLDEACQLISEGKYKKSLKIINSAIDNGVTTNQILFQKAFLLEKTNNQEEANKIWERLSHLKNKPKLAASAKQLLETSKKNQAKRVETTKSLINSLHAEAENYQHKLDHLTTSKDWLPNLNIIHLICKEASVARILELPKLSFELIDKTLKAGLESPSLIHDKALSLSMMGQHLTALGLLDQLSQSVKNPEIKKQIQECKIIINTNSNYHDSRKSYCLLKEINLALKSSSIENHRIPEDPGSRTDSEVKSLIYEQARDSLNKSPEITLILLNSILAYYPADNASIQLKGEALAFLKRDDEAIQTWKNLVHSENNEIAQKAMRSISRSITQIALHKNTFKSPAKALSFYIKEHLKIELSPTYNEYLKEILQRLESDIQFSDPEIEQQQLQLVFNTKVIEHLEAQLSEQARLNIKTTSQQPGAISKTASKAG